MSAQTIRLPKEPRAVLFPSSGQKSLMRKPQRGQLSFSCMVFWSKSALSSNDSASLF